MKNRYPTHQELQRLEFEARRLRAESWATGMKLVSLSETRRTSVRDKFREKFRPFAPSVLREAVALSAAAVIQPTAGSFDMTDYVRFGPQVVVEERAHLEAAVGVGDEVEVSIADNGIGFEMEYHDHIFKLFQRLHFP